MRSRVISIDKRYVNEYGYIIRSVRMTGITHAESHTKTRYRLYTAETDAQADVLTPYLAEVLLTPMKYGYFARKLGKYKGIVNTALILTLLDFDSVAERIELCERLYSKSYLPLDGIFNFAMSRNKTNWDALIILTTSFLELSPDEEDVMGLASFIVSSGGNKQPQIIDYPLFTDPALKVLLQSVYYHRPLDFSGQKKATCEAKAYQVADRLSQINNRVFD